jgi:uncharacterized surface protein with fasciclin (FAS1) repeats
MSKNSVATAPEGGSFTTLLAAGDAAVGDALADGGPLTVFARSGEAFAKLPPGTVESLVAAQERLKVTAPDMTASSGVIHVIKKVLIP